MFEDLRPFQNALLHRFGDGCRLSVQDDEPADQSHGRDYAEDEGNCILGHRNLLPMVLTIGQASETGGALQHAGA